MIKTSVNIANRHFLIIPFLIWANSLFGQSIELTCMPNTGDEVHYRCRLNTTALAKPIDGANNPDGTQFYETSYSITYHFPCCGHETGLVFKSDNDSKPVTFGGEADPELSVTVTGNTDLVLSDDNPQKTYKATLVGICKIQVVKVDPVPSFNTLDKVWQQEAITSAKDITGALKLWQQSKNFDKVITWDNDQLKATQKNLEEQIADSLIGSTLTYQDLLYPLDYPDPKLRGRIKDAKDMPAEWQTAVLTDSTLPDKVALLSQVNATLAGRPPVYDPTSTANYRKELDKNIDKANKILGRADTWKDYLTSQQKATYKALLAKKTAAETAK